MAYELNPIPTGLSADALAGNVATLYQPADTTTAPTQTAANMPPITLPWGGQLGDMSLPYQYQPSAATLAGALNQAAQINQRELQASAVHHSRLANSLNSVAQIFNSDRGYALQQTPDGMVQAVPTPLTTGQRWAQLAAAALSGAAQGFAVGQGPGGPGRAAAAGFATGMQMPQQFQTQALQTAERMNQQTREQMLFKANMAKMQLELANLVYQNQDAGIKRTEHADQLETEWSNTVHNLHLTDAGPAPTVADAAHLHNYDPAIQQAATDGRIIMHHGADGQIHMWVRPVDTGNQLITEPQDVTYLSPDTDGNIRIARTEHYDAGSNTVAAMQALQLNALKFNEQARKDGAQIVKDKETPAGGSYGQPINMGTEQNPNWQRFPSKGGPPIPANIPPGATGLTPAQTAAAQARTQAVTERKLAAERKEFDPIVKSVNSANDYMQGGRFTGPGDYAMLMDFVNATKPSAGFRFNEAERRMILDSQSVFNSVAAKAQHALTPEAPWFSETQRRAIFNVIMGASRTNNLKFDPQGRAQIPSWTPTPATPAAPGAAPAAPTAPTGTFNWNQYPKAP